MYKISSSFVLHSWPGSSVVTTIQVPTSGLSPPSLLSLGLKVYCGSWSFDITAILSSAERRKQEGSSFPPRSLPESTVWHGCSPFPCTVVDRRHLQGAMNSKPPCGNAFLNNCSSSTENQPTNQQKDNNWLLRVWSVYGITTTATLKPTEGDFICSCYMQPPPPKFFGEPASS